MSDEKPLFEEKPFKNTMMIDFLEKTYEFNNQYINFLQKKIDDMEQHLETIKKSEKK